jgi:Phosphatidylserine/phosphatidylglycerophosphate/cardiolipin synthases and related enzymes
MRIETGERLAQSLRKLGDGIQKRLWVAVPYIGNLKLVRKVLGARWLQCKGIDVRLMIDYSNPQNFDYETLKSFKREGKIKTITGLHAKIYILDNKALITSANLTNTAFSRRFEIGTFLSENEAERVIAYYKKWWESEAKDIPGNRLKIPYKNSINEIEEAPSRGLTTRWLLPEDPGDPQRWFFINTNRKTDEKCEKDMIKHQKAAAYYGEHKGLIDKLKKGDVVFLYGSGSGIVAMGEVATGKRKEKYPVHGSSKEKKEEYYMELSNFKKLKKPLPSAEIKRICNKKIIFRPTMFSEDEKSGEKIKKEITKHYI